MPDDFVIRRCQSGDGIEIVDLLNAVFKGWPHLDLGCEPLDFWTWKHVDAIEKSLVIVTEDGDRLIGCHHGMLFRVRVFDEILLASYGADMAVHPEYRRRGLSKKQIEFLNNLRKETDVKFTLMIANPMTIEHLERSFPRFPVAIRNYVRIMDIDEQLEKMPVDRKWMLKGGYYFIKLCNDVRNALKDRMKADADCKISRIQGFDDRIEGFWGDVSNHYDFIVERRKEYLNWRYCDSRVGDFVVEHIIEDDRVIGYCVLRINRYNDEYPIGYIVELLTLPDRLDAAQALLADAKRYFDDQGVNIVNCLVVKGHPLEKALRMQGFLNGRIGMHLFYNPLGDVDVLNRIEGSHPSRVYFSWGDCDILPVNIPSY